MPVTIRQAARSDSATIHRLIVELAVFEELEHAVKAEAADIERMGFGERPYFECLLAEEAGEALGFALYFHNFSTFEGRPGVYLEDLFVTPAARGKGVGRALIAALARVCQEQDFRRLDLSVLHWNPARRFYEALGMTHNDQWLGYRLEGEALAALAQSAD
jgi:GNAT superfamily N-acetyltransferase